jgi:hypothetical protein
VKSTTLICVTQIQINRGGRRFSEILLFYFYGVRTQSACVRNYKLKELLFVKDNGRQRNKYFYMQSFLPSKDDEINNNCDNYKKRLKWMRSAP